MTLSFEQRFAELFEVHFRRVFRYLDRLCGDPDVAEDLAQEAFVRLYRRRELPDHPEAWLVTVATNLCRNAWAKGARHRRLLTVARAEASVGSPPRSPADLGASVEPGDAVRAALEALPERDRQLLLLRAEGYRYRELALALGLNEASVGTLLARARQAFRQAYGEPSDAP